MKKVVGSQLSVISWFLVLSLSRLLKNDKASLVLEVSKTMTKHDPRKLTKFYEITRTNLILTSCGFVDRSLIFLFFQQPVRSLKSRFIPSYSMESVTGE